MARARGFCVPRRTESKYDASASVAVDATPEKEARLSFGQDPVASESNASAFPHAIAVLVVRQTHSLRRMLLHC